jgi:hypothetical protein
VLIVTVAVPGAFRAHVPAPGRSVMSASRGAAGGLRDQLAVQVDYSRAPLWPGLVELCSAMPWSCRPSVSRMIAGASR